MNENEIEALASDALNAACLLIQQRLGVKTGDLAGIIFSDDVVLLRFEAYIEAELREKA